MNPFNDFKAIIVAELEALAREGTLPDGLDTARVEDSAIKTRICG